MIKETNKVPRKILIQKQLALIPCKFLTIWIQIQNNKFSLTLIHSFFVVLALSITILFWTELWPKITGIRSSLKFVGTHYNLMILRSNFTASELIFKGCFLATLTTSAYLLFIALNKGRLIRSAFALELGHQKHCMSECKVSVALILNPKHSFRCIIWGD